MRFRSASQTTQTKSLYSQRPTQIGTVTHEATQKQGSMSPLRSGWGELILRKGTLLYHISDDPFQPNTEKPLLFTVFHPSEGGLPIDNYVTRIRILRDVSLFFMIGGFHKMKILPLLNEFVKYPGRNTNLVKQYDINNSCFATHLREEHFDGWFSTIEGKETVEVALLNDPSIWAAEPSESFQHTWTNSNIKGGRWHLKHWGKKYPLSFMNPILRINLRYKEAIETYLHHSDMNLPGQFVFPILLRTAIIYYHEGVVTPVVWNCPVSFRPV